MNPVVLSLPHAQVPARRLARRIGAEAGRLVTRRFPDGEWYVRLDGDVRDRAVLFFGSLDRPDEKLLPLLFGARTARELGAASVGLAAPYLPYLRQDARFQPGEALGAAAFAEILESRFDWLITVEPHLHRLPALGRIFRIPVEVVRAAPALAAWIRAEVERPLVVGPDAESAAWVRPVADAADAPWIVLEKRRLGDRDVAIGLPDLAAHRGRTPVLVDDILSTGATMAAAAQALRRAGFPEVLGAAVHAVFAPASAPAIRSAGLARLVTCDTIPHSSNAIWLDPLLAPVLARRLAAGPAAAPPPFPTTAGVLR